MVCLMNELPQILDAEEVAAYLKCTTKTVREKATSGDLVGTKIGRDWIFRAADIAAFLDKEISQQINNPTGKPSGKRNRIPSLV